MTNRPVSLCMKSACPLCARPTQTDAQSQTKANEFVLQHFKNTYKDQSRHLHIPTSLVLSGLEAAYIKEHMKVCPDGRMVSMAGFSLTQVYTAYYAALAAETSLSLSAQD